VVATVRERVYTVRFEQEDEKADVYEGHSSFVKGHKLMNVRDLDPKISNKPWVFARYSFLTPDVLRVELVNDEELKGVEQGHREIDAALLRCRA
jgi:hypothetical protein